MLDLLIRLIVGALATWRISILIWYEDGPFDVYKSIRDYIALKGTPKMMHGGLNSELWFKHNYFWEYILHQVECFWCISFWVSLPISLLIILPWHQWVILIPFALSGVATLLSGAGRTIWRASNDN
jgi:hypothetical protein